MRVLVHSEDHPITQKHGNKLTKRELQVIFNEFMSNKKVKVALYRCGNRSEVLKGPFESPEKATKGESDRIQEKYPV
jgi:hypothetical protein